MILLFIEIHFTDIMTSMHPDQLILFTFHIQGGVITVDFNIFYECANISVRYILLMETAEIIYEHYLQGVFLFPLPVVVPEFDVPPRLQYLPVLQPGELGLRLALGLTGEDSGGAHRPS